MSDFVLSNKTYQHNILKKLNNTIFDGIYSSEYFYYGDWGTFYITDSPYYGFAPVESDQFIMGVIGGPVLKFTDYNKPKSPSYFSKLIFDHWHSGNISLDEDLSGPFVIIIIDKNTSEFHIYTDLMSFIPVYQYDQIGEKSYSSHVDLLGLLTNQVDHLDQVSISDFILHGIVTYPYTFYQNIKQLPPASEINVTYDNVHTNYYWEPYENIVHTNKEAAQLIDNALNKYISKVLERGSNIAQFISGGEDSRLLSSLLSEYERDAFIFLDQMNREGIMAKKAADKNNANFKYGLRSFEHYLDILPNSAAIVGTNSQYIHAHTYGFHSEFELNHYDSVFGGLFADALLKGSRIGKVRGTGRPYIPDIKQEKNLNEIHSSLYDQNIIDKLMKRRDAHLELIKLFRTESAHEWFFLWPTSMNISFANMDVNRRIFASYEPFLDNTVVKSSATVSQKSKLNRRLFHTMSKPYLRNTKFLLHSDGRLPYYSWFLNIPISAVVNTKNLVFKKLGIIKGVQGPWNDKHALLNSPRFQETLRDLQQKSSQLNISQTIGTKMDYTTLNYLSVYNLLQTLYLLNFLESVDAKENLNE